LSRTRFVVALAASAALLVVGSASAGGPVTNLKTKIRPLTNGKLEYSGRVTSDSPDCVAARRIKISAKGAKIGKPKTDSKGKFDLIGKPLESGTKVRFELKATSTICIGLQTTGTAP
jgi:hypothetical protein